MKILAPHAPSSAMRGVFSTLCRVPEDVRRLALERVKVVLLEPRAVNGFACKTDGGWIVALVSRDGMDDTFAHELGHVVSEHYGEGVELERAAADLAAGWGFAGHSADADSCAASFSPGTRAPAIRAVVGGDAVTMECRTCGSECGVLAPTVPDLAADLGVECPRCGTFDAVSLAGLAPCGACGGRAAVEWAAGATPEKPVATWTCACGASATREVNMRPAARSQDYAAFAIGDAVRALAAVAEFGRGDALSVDARAMWLAGAGASLGWARMRAAAAVQHMDELDQRRPAVDRAMSEMAGAGEALARRDVAGAVAAVELAAATLRSALAENSG